MKDFIEQKIIYAVQDLLKGRVNEILREIEYPVPVIESGGYGCGFAVVPVISLSACEQSEKERIVRLDAYSLTITFTFAETHESELYCYLYSGAISKAIRDNPTMGGIADKAVITGKKYISPKKPDCGDDWQLVVALRITVEGF